MLSVADTTTLQGDSNTTVTIPVTMPYPSIDPVTFTVQTVDGTASSVNNRDYYAITPTTVTFQPGQTTYNVTVQIHGGTIVVPDKTFYVEISSTGTPVADGKVLVTIQNDHFGGQLYFTLSNYTVDEQAGTATITVERSGGTAGGVTVQYATVAGGTALSSGPNKQYTRSRARSPSRPTPGTTTGATRWPSTKRSPSRSRTITWGWTRPWTSP